MRTSVSRSRQPICPIALFTMRVISECGSEIVFAAFFTNHGFADLVRGAQVEDKMIFSFHDLEAELADEL